MGEVRVEIRGRGLGPCVEHPTGCDPEDKGTNRTPCDSEFVVEGENRARSGLESQGWYTTPFPLEAQEVPGREGILPPSLPLVLSSLLPNDVGGWTIP